MRPISIFMVRITPNQTGSKPAVVMIGVWALLQFVNGLGAIAVTDQTSGVAYWAHIGGFIAGAVITLLAKPFLDRGTGAPSRVAAPY